ncbi:MAG: S8 family serine peptidase, partial [Sciscionella sp.]
QDGSTISVADISEHRGNVGLGVWGASIQEIGPFGPSGATKGSASYTASLRTDGFDAAVSSSTGDPFAIAVDPSATGGAPVIIQPGKKATITVTITPKGRSGQTMAGHLNLVTVPGQFTGDKGLPEGSTGEVIATLPYRYTVK